MKSIFSKFIISLMIIGVNQSYLDVKAENMTKQSSISILGTGRMGKAIGANLSSQGYSVIYGSRTPESPEKKSFIDETLEDDSIATYQDSIKDAEIIFLALPWHATEDILKSLKGLDNKIIVDVTNALKPSGDGNMEMSVDTSSGELIQEWLSKSQVVKAFNTVGFHIIKEPEAAGGPVTVPIVGDDSRSKEIITKIVQSMGFETVDVGPMKHARSLEMMSVIYMVPYLSGNFDQAFEFYFRKGSAPKVSEGVRSAN